MENRSEKCIIVYDCSEELGIESTPYRTALPFTDKELAEKFINDWNKSKENLIKSDEEENKYYIGDWVYWLEIESSFLNFSIN